MFTEGTHMWGEFFKVEKNRSPFDFKMKCLLPTTVCKSNILSSGILSGWDKTCSESFVKYEKKNKCVGNFEYC